MGYSTPKKQLDLKEFLSQPGKKTGRRQFQFRSSQNEAESSDDAELSLSTEGNNADTAG